MSGHLKQFDVLVVGDLFIDIVMSGCAELPAPGHEAFARAMIREAGGGAAITASGLARLGARTGVIGVVDDVDGAWLAKRLISVGVDTGLLEKHPSEPTGMTVAISSDRDRAFFTYSGANVGLPELLDRSDISTTLQQAHHVHFACCLDPLQLMKLTDLLHAAETRVSLDVGWHPDWLRNEKSIGAICGLDLFLPNEAEASVITGMNTPDAILDAFEHMGIRLLALKMGEKGSCALVNGRKVFSDPVKVDVVDTTGAGDSFDAGFIYGMLHGESPERCLEIGNICGALSTRALGGIAAFPSRGEIFR